MGLVSGLLRGKSKLDAYHSDALILRDLQPDGESRERTIHFEIIPEKKKKTFALALVDGTERRILQKNLTLQSAMALLKRRFALKQEALGTAATTRGAAVVIENKFIPGQANYNWLHVREVFNFLASDVREGSIN